MKTDAPFPDPPGDEEIAVEPKEKSDASTSDAPVGDVVQENEGQNPPRAQRKFAVPSGLAWIPPNATWSKLKPVIRCSLTAWVSVILMIIRPVSRRLGQVNSNIALARSERG